MTGWTLRDSENHVFTFGTYTLQAHSYVKIRTGSGTRTRANRYWGRSWYIWNNTGDTSTLERPAAR
jgi:Lamin Tail Domain